MLGVRQKAKQFVVTIVLPANSRDLAVLSKQLAAAHKDTFYDLFPSSFIVTELQIQNIFTSSTFTVRKDSESATVMDRN